ncbi:Inositolphosphorylceramide synthase subunit Kei1-domain-containing protein [Lipomyces japonicus]|uniref:Inositolphosphorylceramide synthase subunit Kei1-domain-containing protein n=1 Tax=Lipomyces japonicus TaxID=56871 RepID=UPI0034CFC7DD
MLSIVPKQYFLGFIPLSAGAELITVFGVVNKASGIYGLLSIFTGHPITGPQLALNIISLVLLPFFLYALHNVRRQNPLPVVAYAYVYFGDMLANVAFTIYFAVSWFRKFDSVVKQQEDGDSSTETLDTASERGLSITIITFILLLKVYFCFVLFGYARALVRKAGLRADNGEGGSQRVQFLLLSIAPSFWRRGGPRAGKGRMTHALEEYQDF